MKMTSERAKEILASKGRGTFGSFAVLIEDAEYQEVDEVCDQLLREYSGKRFIFWDEALEYMVTGELPAPVSK